MAAKPKVSGTLVQRGRKHYAICGTCGMPTKGQRTQQLAERALRGHANARHSTNR